MQEILYKITSKGQIQQWEIIVEEDTFYTVEGILNGKLTKSKPTKCFGKNVGKVNETTPTEQAIQEARSKHQHKLDKGYTTYIPTERTFNVMLAVDLADCKSLPKQVYISPKLDGIRCYTYQGQTLSRNHKLLTSCPHLCNVFENIILDGELYNHDLKNDFEQIVSLVKQQKPIDNYKLIKHYIYDIVSDTPYSQRLNTINEWYNNLSDELKQYYEVVEAKLIDSTDIPLYHQKYIEQGWEGSIIRLDNYPYEQKRSKSLLKNKDFIDAEFTIIDVLSGKGNSANMAAKLVVIDDNRRQHLVTVTGNESFMQYLLVNKKLYVGMLATVKFFGYTKQGALRFPTLKSVRNYE